MSKVKTKKKTKVVISMLINTNFHIKNLRDEIFLLTFIKQL